MADKPDSPTKSQGTDSATSSVQVAGKETSANSQVRQDLVGTMCEYNYVDRSVCRRFQLSPGNACTYLVVHAFIASLLRPRTTGGKCCEVLE